MSDLVNEHFKKHYPADAGNVEPDYCVGGYQDRYQGKASTIFPKIKCADGFEMSVQGHFGAYSIPRDDFADRYSAVEILCPADPLLDEHGGSECGDDWIYGYVPVELVQRVISLTAA